jgi:hypothetical protein
MVVAAAAPDEGFVRAAFPHCHATCCCGRSEALPKEVTMMRRLGTLLSFAAALVLVCGVAGDARPTKQFTRPCELSGDASGEGEVGVKAFSYGPPMTMSTLQGALAALFGAIGLTEDSYTGPVRVLEDRLDFYFDTDDDPTNCGPYEDNDDGTPRCPYCLLLINGVYDQNEDKVVFATPGTQAFIYATDNPASPVSEGTANLVVQFTDGDGGGDATETGGACKDGIDNDGDELYDCDDPDCATMGFCK